MKKILIPVVALSILLSGCWDLIESEKLGLVTLVGIDSADNQQVKVLIQETSKPKKGSSDQKGGSSDKAPAKTREAVAPTVTDAVEKIIASDFRRTDFSHTYVIILSEELVYSAGIRPFIDFFERMPEIRRNTWLLIAMKDQFNKIFNPDFINEPDADPSKVILEIMHNKPANSYISANTLGDFLNLLWERGSEPYTSGISQVKTDISIENTAVFRKEKLAGWMDNRESKGLLWARGGINGGTLTVNFEGNDLSLRIVRAGSETKPKIADGKMEVDIRVNVVTNLVESRTNLDFSKINVIKKVQDLQAEEIKNQILAAYEKSKQLNSDVFGFGNYFFGKYPKVWKQIETSGFDYYRNVSVNVDVNSRVNNIGLVKKPIDTGTVY